MYSYITEYYNKILAGEIIVGKWIKKLYKIVIARLDSKEYYFDEKRQSGQLNLSKLSCTTAREEPTS